MIISKKDTGITIPFKDSVVKEYSEIEMIRQALKAKGFSASYNIQNDEPFFVVTKSFRTPA